MPKSKKKDSATSSDSDSGPDDRAPPPSKKSKDTQKSSDDDKGGAKNQWVLEKQRRISISEFRGRKLIDIREYYEKNGESLPGKKGISLSVNQWKKLLEVSEEVNRAVGE